MSDTTEGTAGEPPVHGRGEGWSTACGLDRANVSRWTDDPAEVTCYACRSATPDADDASERDVEPWECHPSMAQATDASEPLSECQMYGEPGQTCLTAGPQGSSRGHGGHAQGVDRGRPVMTCEATMESIALPGHVHSCSGGHTVDGDHKCSDPTCRRWFYSKEV